MPPVGLLDVCGGVATEEAALASHVYCYHGMSFLNLKLIHAETYFFSLIYLFRLLFLYDRPRC